MSSRLITFLFWKHSSSYSLQSGAKENSSRLLWLHFYDLSSVEGKVFVVGSVAELVAEAAGSADGLVDVAVGVAIDPVVDSAVSDVVGQFDSKGTIYPAALKLWRH